MLRNLETGNPVDVLDALFAESRVKEAGPWVMLNMVVTVDGATAFGGGASGINDADDRGLFLALRSVADIVLMGARTVRSENLGPIRMSAEMAAYRSQTGRDNDPTLAILSRSLDIDPEHRVFSDQSRRPTIITERGTDPDRLERLDEVADFVLTDHLDGAGIVGALSAHRIILCEGGPTVNSQLLAANAVDEVNLTVSPLVALGTSNRLASGPVLETPIEMAVDRRWMGDRSLFLRFLKG